MVEAALTSLKGAPTRDARGVTRGLACAVVEAHRDVADAASAWDTLERSAPASPYQTRAWMEAWLDTRGASLGITPMIIVARDAVGQPLALLPLGFWRSGLMTVAGFLGGRDSNCNLGLFRPGTDWDRQSVLTLLRQGIAAAKAGVDVVSLHNQPIDWEGLANPLALLPRQPSPSFGHKVDLQASPELFWRATLSKDTRKKLRRKMERLGQLGTVSHRQAMTEAERHAVLDAFVRQRTARNAALGLDCADLPELRRFLGRASGASRGPAAAEVHGLHCGDRIVATFIGTAHRSRFCGMSMSFDTDPLLARCSPGELMISAMLGAKCSAGLAVFDLGIGEARYKTIYCPKPEVLVDTILPMTGRGLVFAWAERLRLFVKRSIKQSAWAWAAAQATRRGLAALKRL